MYFFYYFVIERIAPIDRYSMSTRSFLFVSLSATSTAGNNLNSKIDKMRSKSTTGKQDQFIDRWESLWLF